MKMRLPSLASYCTLLLTATCSFDFASAKFPIKGVHTGVDSKTGYRPPRRDIEDLVKDVPQFSLYVQAMNAMMSVDERELTSWFQVAGIHGLPFIAWDDVQPTDPSKGNKNLGYCTHGNTLFGMWHRPYMALAEQIMAGFAQDIAKTYNSPEYQKAADALRMPFWDWAATPPRYPPIFKTPNVEIHTPSGPKTVPNPLYKYTFLNNPMINNWFPADYLGEQPHTLRSPDINTNTSRDNEGDRAIAEDPQTESVWKVFSTTKNFNDASTSGTAALSFEGPHGTIHIVIGGGGHFTPFTYSAFDAIFFLHHANVDRQLAMWQAIYPDSFLTPEKSPVGSETWTISEGDILDENTPLTPFTQGDGQTPWTSLAAREVKTFGHSYPDVPDWLFTDPKALSENVTARVQELYNADGRYGPFGAIPQPPIEEPTESLTRRAANTSESVEWTLSAKVPNNAVNGPFSVKFSVGDVYLGRIAALADTASSTFGGFSLRSALKSTDPTDIPAVVRLLKGNIKWTVVKADGAVVNSVKGIEVEVASQKVQYSQKITEFPTYGSETAHPEVLA